MNKYVFAALGIVLLGSGILWGLIGYHPPTSPAEVPYDQYEPDGSYTVTMALTTNGERFATYEVRNDSADGEQLISVKFPNVTRTLYWHDNRSVTRSVATTQKEYQQERQLTDDEQLLRHDNESMTVIVLDPVEKEVGEGLSLQLSTLQYPGYERTGTTTYDGMEVAVYESQNGWYERTSTAGGDGTTFKVDNADGVLYVGTDTGQLYYANVSYDFVSADTWGEYLLNTKYDNEQDSISVTVAYHRGQIDVTRPSWVPNE